MKLEKRHIVIALPVLLAAVAVIVLIIRAATPDKIIVTGIIETDEIDVASKIPGRVDSLYVREGEKVAKGQVIAKLSSREVDAKVEQARGMMEAARAKMDMANTGARPEEKETMEKKYLAAKHQFELAEKTWKRINQLYQDSVVSAQEHDQIDFQYKAAKDQLDATYAQYRMVLEGVRSEERRAAEALFHQAENAYNEALSYQQETHLICPIDGEVSKRSIDQGEMVAAGFPVVTAFNPTDVWIVLQLREDQMTGVRQDAQYRVTLPAIDKLPHEFRVSYIAPMADFATWRSTNQKGDFDLKTFEVHLSPANPISGLRPGMTARVQL